MEGAPSVVRPHNLAGFSSNISTNLITCSHICSRVVVEERLVMSKKLINDINAKRNGTDEYDKIGCVTYVYALIES